MLTLNSLDFGYTKQGFRHHTLWPTMFLETTIYIYKDVLINERIKTDEPIRVPLMFFSEDSHAIIQRIFDSEIIIARRMYVILSTLSIGLYTPDDEENWY